MTLPTREENALLKEARKNRDKGQDFERTNWDEAREDLKFIAGEQWEETVLQERRDDSRPALTINQLPQFVRQVTGDVRLNPPAIKVLPAEGGDIGIAKTYAGLIRNIEYQSKAKKAYVTAAESSARCGMGHWRIVTEFADDDTFNQEIRIKRIVNPFAVLWDPSAEEADKSDAGWVFVLSEVDRDAFKQKWPEAAVTDWETEDVDYDVTLWVQQDTVTVAEYWRKEQLTKTLAQLETGEVLDVTEFTEEQKAGLPIVQTREVDSHKIVQYHITDSEVLEGPNEWIGSQFPVIPVIGEEIHIGERVVRHGIARHAKDPQRQYNYWQTHATETVALAPKSPYIGTEKQIENHPEWQDANQKNYSILTYTGDPDAPGPPQRNPPPDFPAAAVNMMQISGQDMKSTIGLHDPNLGALGNETSGLAISLRQSQGNVGTFVYIDNIADAIESTGKQLIEIIPKVYDTERVVRVLGEDGAEELVTINQPVGFDEAGNTVLANDITIGKYDVVVETGPSFATKRLEASRGMIEFVQAIPAAGAATADLIARAQDWPMAEEFAERLKPPEGPPPPDPKDIAKAEKDAAAAQKTIAETATLLVDAENTASKTEGQELDNIMKQLEISAQSGALDEIIRSVVERQLIQLLNGNVVPLR